MSRILLFLAFVSLPSQAQTPRQRQYLRLAEATLRQPITPDELRASVLAPRGVTAIRELFERSLSESLVVEDKLVTPELGGEATLDGGSLVLVPYPDPIHPLIREMVKLERDPMRLLSFLESSPDGKEVLATTGGLHALLYQMATKPATAEQRELLAKIVASAVATRFKTWSAEPETQARVIEATEWRGRYVGFWHIHPVRLRGEELAFGIEPSVEDMTNAVRLGQFLTIVFQPEGFDAYDLSPLARARTPDLGRARVVSYRSADWKPHFEKLVRAKRAE